ncbi:itaconate CoA-transferase [Nitrobacteraceae bacterium AZCC 2161]
MRQPSPLDGIVVVSLEQAVAAPFCSSRLADAGARVIKVERPEGDFARGYDDVAAGQSSYFVWLNRGKESVVLDLTSPSGKDALRALLSTADILIQNLKPGAMRRLGFSTESLRLSLPRLIICSISGYGESGPLADRKAYDLLIQAESGLSSITGGPDEPARVGISMVDIAAGITAYSAVLEALMLRSKSGHGCEVHVSMFDVMADWLTVPLLHQEAGRTPRRLGLAHPSIAPYGIFGTKDGKTVLISIQSDREWAAFCVEFLKSPAAAQDPRFRTNLDRVRNRSETDRVVASAVAEMDLADVWTSLERADVAFSSVNDMADLSDHPHLRRITVETPNGPVSYPAPAPIFKNMFRSYGAVPGLGEHTPLTVHTPRQTIAGSPERAT